MGDPLPPLPRPVRGVHVRAVLQTACPGYFALVWLDAEPGHGGTDMEFADGLPDTSPREFLPAEFRSAFAKGVREGLARLGGGRSPYAVRIVLRDALWSEIDSNTRSFEAAGGYAATEILACVREGRDPRPAGLGARPDRPAPAMPRDHRRARTYPDAGPTD
ncbi:hypothetical protein [Nocardiopsis aegyptia]|uniref:Translation elongation factor EFG/EF2 domain-containing protein n=1 Tax=Nocardiopsis aegyptia TaxID=220378 RepID=A0A7Z0EJ21_9ACTN|nr:hypothetical protein [Nocardiopsis aegyptia]NYJ33020.1 hypothetical protein [Nocardiopsis aegyptia]